MRLLWYLSFFFPQILSSGVPSVTLQWSTTSMPGNLAQSSQQTPSLLSIFPPLTPWQTSLLFTGPQKTCSNSWVTRWRSLSHPRFWKSETGTQRQPTGPFRARRRGTFLWVWQGSVVARGVLKMISDACAEAGRRGGVMAEGLWHEDGVMSCNGQCPVVERCVGGKIWSLLCLIAQNIQNSKDQLNYKDSSHHANFMSLRLLYSPCLFDILF